MGKSILFLSRMEGANQQGVFTVVIAKDVCERIRFFSASDSQEGLAPFESYGILPDSEILSHLPLHGSPT